MRLITVFLIFLLGAGSPCYCQVYFTEDFETVTIPALPLGWTATTTGTTGWKSHTGPTAFTNGWAIPAHSQYAVVDDWNNPNDINNPGRISTPSINLSTATKPYLYFEYYYTQASYMGGSESCIIEVSTNGGAFYTFFAFLPGNFAGGWHPIYLDASAYAGQSNVQFAISYMDGNDTLMGAAIDNIKVFEPPADDIELKNTNPVPGGLTAYGIANASIILGGTIFNSGLSTITSFALKYQEGTGPVVTDNITGLNVAPFTSASFSATTPFSLPATLADYNIKLWAELPGDSNSLNDSGSTTLTTVPYMPAKRILAEEGTGTWCGWCPRGAVYMDSIAKNSYNSSFSLVAVHNADTMTMPAYDAKLDSLIGGYPSVAIDRRQVIDPNKLINIYNEQKDYFGYADITLSNVLPIAYPVYKLMVNVKPVIDLPGDYRLALAITENGVKGIGPAWEQENYYSYQMGNIPFTGAGLDWQAEPRKVPASKMVYDHVARGIFPDANGAAGSLPLSMTAGNTYSYTFNVALNFMLFPYQQDIHAVVMLIRNADGHVLNSNHIALPVGISDIDAGIQDFRVFPNPASNHAYINFSLEKSVNVKVIITDAIGRTISVTENKGMESGKHRLTIDVSRFVSGVYNVTLQTDNGNISGRLSVMK
jgi:hypothetical protein